MSYEDGVASGKFFDKRCENVLRHIFCKKSFNNLEKQRNVRIFVPKNKYMDNKNNIPTIQELSAENQEIVLFRTDDEQVAVDVIFAEETVWLTIDQMSRLYEKSRSTINEHILNIYAEGELSPEESLRKIGISDFSTKPTNYYNLDVIISVGYRVKSLRGTKFRQWATKRLNEYFRKGFTMDDERLKD